MKFIVFPGEPHGPRKLTHQMRKVDEEVGVVRQIFLQDGEGQQRSGEGRLAARSAAAREERRRASARITARRLTVKGKGVLIPEVVLRGNLEIGRFEVTRAQYAESDKSYKFEPGTENYPASGITFDQAKAYAAWLSKTTGQTWRVPNQSEVASMYEKKDGENTLDYWAGYSLNYDDAALLQKKLGELSGNAPLLKPVGSFAGQGKDDRRIDLRPRRKRRRMGDHERRQRQSDRRQRRPADRFARGPRTRAGVHRSARSPRRRKRPPRQNRTRQYWRLHGRCGAR